MSEILSPHETIKQTVGESVISATNFLNSLGSDIKKIWPELFCGKYDPTNHYHTDYVQIAKEDK